MRLDGWEGRLAALLEDARERPYELGDHDCFRLACRVAHALTGVDHWPAFCGYRTEREALKAIAIYGSSFLAAGDRFFGSEHVASERARRGDIMAYRDARGQHHLGICAGRNVAVLGAAGLQWIAPAECVCCWRVG